MFILTHYYLIFENMSLHQCAFVHHTVLVCSSHAYVLLIIGWMHRWCFI